MSTRTHRWHYAQYPPDHASDIVLPIGVIAFTLLVQVGRNLGGRH